MQAVPLSKYLGVEVEDVDLTVPLTDDVVESLRSLFMEHSLLLFRGQDISEDDQRRLLKEFGPISTELLPDGAEEQGAYYLSNLHADGQGELIPHSDHCFVDRPLWGISLYAHAVPSTGGDTIFTSSVAALGNLPVELRHRLEGLEAVHVYRPQERIGDAELRSTSVPDLFSAHRPAIWAHPVSGTPVLYVNPWMTKEFTGPGTQNADTLLAEVLPYLADPSISYRHAWRQGDFLLWDNIALLHARTPYDPDEERLLFRLQLGLP